MDPLCTLMCVSLAYWIYVIIHMEKTFRAVQCQRCGKFLNEKKYHKTLAQKAHDFFWFYIEGIAIPDALYKIQN